MTLHNKCYCACNYTKSEQGTREFGGFSVRLRNPNILILLSDWLQSCVLPAQLSTRDNHRKFPSCPLSGRLAFIYGTTMKTGRTCICCDCQFSHLKLFLPLNNTFKQFHPSLLISTIKVDFFVCRYYDEHQYHCLDMYSCTLFC